MFHAPREGVTSYSDLKPQTGETELLTLFTTCGMQAGQKRRYGSVMSRHASRLALIHARRCKIILYRQLTCTHTHTHTHARTVALTLQYGDEQSSTVHVGRTRMLCFSSIQRNPSDPVLSGRSLFWHHKVSIFGGPGALPRTLNPINFE